GVIGIVAADLVELGVGWERVANADQPFVSQQIAGRAPVFERSDLSGRAGGPIDQTKKGLGAGAGVEAGLSACRADGPAVLRLMAGEASASVAADVLEERIPGSMCDATRLVGRDPSAGIMLDIEFPNPLRCGLGSSADVLELKHLPGMLNGPACPISCFSVVDGVGVLRGCRFWQSVQKKGVCDARG